MKVLAGSFVLFFSFALAFCEDAPTPPPCDVNEHCANNQVCSPEGGCVDPCGVVKCGANGACQVIDHLVVCVCGKGFEGDAFIECTPEKPQCLNATDCRLGEGCSYGKCVEELCVGKMCGENALCSAGECECDLGHGGDANVECIPIPVAPAPTDGETDTEEKLKKPSCEGNLFPQPIGKKHFHVIHKHKANWHNAFMYCVAHGMQLATIENEQENKDILEKIEETGIRNSKFYVSGNDLLFEKHWKWMTTGIPIENFTYWHDTRPHVNTYINCMTYHEKDQTSGYRWWDHYCNYNYPEYFICQDYV